MASGGRNSSRNQRRNDASSRSGRSSWSEALAAVERGDIGAVTLYLQRDGEAYGGAEGQPTMLQIAARNGDLPMAELLVNYYCRINAKQAESGDTALMMALDGGHAKVAELLIAYEKCDYNVQNCAGYTALMKAVEKGMMPAVEQLLMYSPDLECTTVAGRQTALSLAVLAANQEAVCLLMELGANPQHVTSSGKTVAQLAWSLPESGQVARTAKRKICEALTQHRRGMRHSDTADANQRNLIGSRYKNLRLLGDGAHGLAMLVRDMRCSRSGDSKLKVLKRIRGERAATSEGSLQEINVLKQLDHPCVLEILDYFNEDDAVCIVTEHCELGDLQQWTRWAGANDIALPVRLVTDWFLQMLLGLHYLHRLNIIHRDLKPSNVFIKADGTVRIGDFGSSRQLLNANDCAKSIKGTWAYMSPEVLQNERYGAECDMWSLGCTLYELCTGQSLFDASVSKSQLQEKICGGQLPALSDPVPQWMRDAFESLTVRTPGRRPTADSLLRVPAIRGALGSMAWPDLEADCAFLGDSRAGVLPDHDGSLLEAAGDGAGSGGGDGCDYGALLDAVQCQLSDTADIGVEAAAAAAEAAVEAEPLASELESLTRQLGEKQRAGFPLDEVYQLLRDNLDKSVQEKHRLLMPVTQDVEACDMVQMAIVLEQQCFADA